VAALAWAPASSVVAAEVRVAVASNFVGAAREIETVFEAGSGHELKLAFGSTGKHYAQIVNGAPMDVLLAADEVRPRLLEERGAGIVGSRVTYARGRLVLWSPRSDFVVQGPATLEQGAFRHLAIANPRHAPYGVAAREVLEALGLWDRLQPRIVRGENIAQALQFVDSGNAELGLIAASQLTAERRATGSFWEIPDELFQPIDQQAVLLRDEPASREFLEFLGGDEAAEIIRRHGYGVP
jgi:molybdate transport system substrate-binding protein